jgi:hypothetical protein
VADSAFYRHERRKVVWSPIFVQRPWQGDRLLFLPVKLSNRFAMYARKVALSVHVTVNEHISRMLFFAVLDRADSAPLLPN